MTVWYAESGGGIVLHTTKCAAVSAYSDSTVLNSAPGEPSLPPADFVGQCWLCDHGITSDTGRLAPVFRDAADEVDVKAVVTASSPYPPAYRALRKLGTVSENRLRDAGHLQPRVGLSVKSKQHWVDERNTSAGNRSTFLRLLADAIEGALLRYRIRAGFRHDQPYIEGVENQTLSAGCGSNVVETWQWLRDKTDAPIIGESGPPPADPGVSTKNGTTGADLVKKARQKTAESDDDDTSQAPLSEW